LAFLGEAGIDEFTCSSSGTADADIADAYY
jgi:hypothetical protein